MYSAREYVKIECVQRKHVDDRVQSSAMGSQRVRILINKGYRVHTMLEISNAPQREPQLADFDM